MGSLSPGEGPQTWRGGRWGGHALKPLKRGGEGGAVGGVWWGGGGGGGGGGGHALEPLENI